MEPDRNRSIQNWIRELLRLVGRVQNRASIRIEVQRSKHSTWSAREWVLREQGPVDAECGKRTGYEGVWQNTYHSNESRWMVAASSFSMPIDQMCFARTATAGHQSTETRCQKDLGIVGRKAMLERVHRSAVSLAMNIHQTAEGGPDSSFRIEISSSSNPFSSSGSVPAPRP